MADKKIAVILAGCGRMDGSEVQESVLTLWAIHKHNADYQCFAPDEPQVEVINHISNEKTDESRNMMVEAARIARGDVQPISSYQADDFAAVIFPGGMGSAKNLFTYALDGTDCKVHPEVARVITSTHKLNKPIGALCIAPVLIAKVLGDVEVTIGNDLDTAAKIEQMGAKHINTGNGEVWVDKQNKIVTTPCYMLDARVNQIGEGINKLVAEIVKLM